MKWGRSAVHTNNTDSIDTRPIADKKDTHYSSKNIVLFSMSYRFCHVQNLRTMKLNECFDTGCLTGSSVLVLERRKVVEHLHYWRVSLKPAVYATHLLGSILRMLLPSKESEILLRLFHRWWLHNQTVKHLPNLHGASLFPFFTKNGRGMNGYIRFDGNALIIILIRQFHCWNSSFSVDLGNVQA